MTGYRCTAACRHCLYACSPDRGHGDISSGMAREICAALKKGRIGSVHIGGGEPFLDFEGLIALIKELSRAGIPLDYIETNAYWAKESSAESKLARLRGEGAHTLCISVDPYHAEYVPWERPLLLARLCEKTGMRYFLWKDEFLPLLSRLDGKKTHSRGEMEKALGSAYIRDTAMAYGIGMGGRAVCIEEEYFPLRAAENFIDAEPCSRLLSTGHFHVDNEGWFIPPRCTGLRVPLVEAVEGLPPGKYPVYEALLTRGTAGLTEIAKNEGFTFDARGYTSKCNLCFHARGFLAERGYPELPAEHYRESLLHYSRNPEGAERGGRAL
ncbi:MAG: radical SAM protein [Spirochaetaceae bacterium]|nr:radical SAM protein [Spirochaetaceae bacterium]